MRCRCNTVVLAQLHSGMGVIVTVIGHTYLLIRQARVQFTPGRALSRVLTTEDRAAQSVMDSWAIHRAVSALRRK
jgi:hypothetical protein